MGIAFWFPSATMFYMSAALHGLGLPVNRPLVLGASLAAIWAALIVNLVGVRIGKWLENIGGVSAWIVSGLFVLLAAAVWWKRGTATPLNFAPRWDWATVNFWATIAYAMSGFELTGMIAGEVKDPARNLPRAGWIASGCASLFYASATVALLVILPPAQISEMNGLAEAGAEAARSLGIVALGPLVAFLVVASGMGQLGGFGTSVSRLPFAAAADGLLPKAFARIHPRWHTPHVSILTLGGVATFLLIAIQLGDTLRGAYQELVSLMVITGFFPFLYIFGSSWKAGNRLSAVSGSTVTIVAILCAVVPTADTANVWLFEGKLLVGTLAVVGSAWLVYRRRTRI
jgi:amino acid transporter